MKSIRDFEDLLELLEKHRARYLIIGGLAFIDHAKPRYTKDMDLWVAPAAENLARVNAALDEFGSPLLLAGGETGKILQIGLPPNRVAILQAVQAVRFETAWHGRIRDRYGSVAANWINLDCLIRAKRAIDTPRHREDLRVLLEVKKLSKTRGR